METSELIAEYSTERRTVHQEMLFRQLQRCCGDCSGFFHGWAMLMGERNNRGRVAHVYFQMDTVTFRKHQRACQLAMEDVEKVDTCIQALEGLWDKDWKNPADTRFTRDRTEEKREQYHRLYGGRPQRGCLDPDYRIEG